MANVYRCDKCGGDCGPNNSRTVKLAALGSGNAGTGIPAGGTDLCGRCVQYLEHWLRQPLDRPAAVSR